MERPSTSNPKRRKESLISSAAVPLAATNGPITSADIDPAVMWSSEDVPVKILARPHTSNPRYVENLSRDSPQARNSLCMNNSPSPSNTPTPCAPSDSRSDHTDHVNSTGILWSDRNEDPTLLARPVSSNPWLQRLFDTIETIDTEAMTPRRSDSRTSQILWSSNDVSDWRMLARPHASNPLLERHQEVSDQIPSPVSGGDSCVLWAREEPSSMPDRNEELQALVRQQSARIIELEDRIRQLEAEHARTASGVSGSGSGSEEAARRPSTAYPNDPAAGSHDAVPTDHARLVRELSGAERLVIGDEDVFVPPPQCEEDISCVTTTDPSATPSAAMSPSPPALPMPAAHNGHQPQPHSANPPAAGGVVMRPAPPRQAFTGRTEDVYIREDTEVGNPLAEALFDRGVVGAHHMCTAPDGRNIARPESALPSRRAARLRQTVRTFRPTTAPPQRVMAFGHAERAPTTYAASPPARSGSAQAVRTCLDTVNRANGFSGTRCLQQQYSADIEDAFRALLRRGEQAVHKDDFRDLYLQRAREYGMFPSERDAEDLMDPFISAGPDHLLLEEFAILYLKISQW